MLNEFVKAAFESADRGMSATDNGPGSPPGDFAALHFGFWRAVFFIPTTNRTSLAWWHRVSELLRIVSRLMICICHFYGQHRAWSDGAHLSINELQRWTGNCSSLASQL
jgi:hypothetical protein